MRRIHLFLSACALALAGCSNSVTPSPVGPTVSGPLGVAPSQWSAEYSAPVSLSAAPIGWEFVFPTISPGVNYIVTAQAVKPTKSIAMTVNVTTTGNPTFDYHTASNNICSTPSTVRIYFQRQGDDLSGTAGSTEYYAGGRRQLSIRSLPAK